MNKFYITFGQKHPLRDGFVLVEAPTRNIAIQLTFETFGNKYSCLYTLEEFKITLFPHGQFGYSIRW